MRTVLDTSVLIHGSPHQLEGELAISAASLAELHFGVLLVDDPDKRAARLSRLAAIERDLSALPVDAAVAASYGTLAAFTVRAGRQPRRRALDLLIAATAHAHQARLATLNAKDLAHLSGHIDLLDLTANRR